jgi:hypothetical protein
MLRMRKCPFACKSVTDEPRNTVHCRHDLAMAPHSRSGSRHLCRDHVEFAETFNEYDPSLRSSKIELETFLKYEIQLRRLQLQEARLARRREKETAELRNLQQLRQRQTFKRKQPKNLELALNYRFKICQSVPLKILV